MEFYVELFGWDFVVAVAVAVAVALAAVFAVDGVALFLFCFVLFVTQHFHIWSVLK